MKIVFLDAATIGSDISMTPVSSLGEYVAYDSTSPEEAPVRVSDCEILIINKVKVTKELIDAAPKLRLICEAATGTNNIDMEYAAAKGIPVKNVAAYSTESVVQTTFMHLLALVGRSAEFDAEMKDGSYSRSGCFTDVTKPFHELDGKTIGIIGMGNIGSRVASVASAFGMKVVYYSTSGTSHCTDYPSLPIEELLKVSDVVSVHAPMNARTDNLLTYDKIALMKPTSYLLNLGRGGIVNEADLARAIDEKLIAGAAVDVFTAEPLPASNPLLNVKEKGRLLLSPHIAWASREARARLVDGIAKNILYLQSL